METTKLAVVYLLLQGATACLWWTGLLTSSAFARHFFPERFEDSFWIALLVPDLIFYAGFSFLSAYALCMRKRWAVYALLVLSGATAYATSYALTLAITHKAELAGVVLMLGSLMGTLYVTWRSCRP